MKRYIHICIGAILLLSCQDTFKQKSNFKEITYLQQENIIRVDSSGVEKINIEKLKKTINASSIIKEVKYIPLETTPESLIGYYCYIIIYNDLIYILDDISAEAVFIYDINGKFVKRLGDKGGGPEEFYLLAGMRIDRENNFLILYDNRKRKMVYYTLKGDFIKSIDLPYRFSGQYEILSDGKMVGVTSKSSGNFHLDEYDNYRLLYTDSLGHITNVGFHFDDNLELSMAWSNILYNSGQIFYKHQYTNSVFSVSDSTIKEKYRIEYPSSPFNLNMIAKLKNISEFDNYAKETMLVDPYMAINKTHVYFSVSDKGKRGYYFYDKVSKKTIGFNSMAYDSNFMMDPPAIYNYDDWFVGTISAESLKSYLEYSKVSNIKLSHEEVELITGLQEDDNPVIVLFKVKDL